MIVTSVQIKTVKMQKHLYCPVFTSLFHNMEHIGKPSKIEGTEKGVFFINERHTFFSCVSKNQG